MIGRIIVMLHNVTRTVFVALLIIISGSLFGCGSGDSADSPATPASIPQISFSSDWPQAGTADGLCSVPAEAQAADSTLPDHVVGDGTPAGSVSKLLAKISQNDRESHTLAALRDELLPKLISGELRLRDVK